MSKWVFFFFLSIPLVSSAQQKFEFVKEVIDFEINSERFSVNGIYYFSNNTEQETRQIILFPFPLKVDSLVVKRVFNLTCFENLSFHELNNAITFEILVLPKDTVKINIAYSQQTAKENIYILESTQTWGQALKVADYSLKFDTSVQIDSLSLNPDALHDNVYHWKKKNFYPNANFIVWLK